MKITHWISTGLISALLIMSAGMYIFNHSAIEAAFTHLGFPLWLIYPMAIAKIGGVVMILTKFDETWTEWAYAGIFFNLLLALGAHVSVHDGAWISPFVGLVLILVSYFTWKRLKIAK